MEWHGVHSDHEGEVRVDNGLNGSTNIDEYKPLKRIGNGRVMRTG